MLKKDSKPEPAPAGANPALAGVAGTGSAPALDAGGAPAAAAPTGSAIPSTLPPPTAESLIPGPGLPAEVVKAWEGGDAIVLLIVRNKGVDDRLVKGSVRGMQGDSEIAVFVAKAKDVARYSRITQGVGVTRVPALVVVRPQRLSGSVPQAHVSYGFRDSQSVLQAVDDALYSGRDDIPYHPG